MKMKSSKLPTIRVFGQRPIPSQFLYRSLKSDGKEDGQCKARGKDMRLSLSNFLDRKLQKGPGLTKSVQMQMVAVGGTATWKALTMIKWAAMKCGSYHFRRTRVELS